jgi:hypothetical protein
MITFAVAFTRDPRRSRQQAPEASLDVLVLSSNRSIPCPPGNMTSLGETLDFNPFFVIALSEPHKQGRLSFACDI